MTRTSITVLASSMLSRAQRKRLDLLYQALNPLQLCTQLDDALHTLRQMAQPDPRTGEKIAALDELETAGNS